jgi:hypothetical protein
LNYFKYFFWWNFTNKKRGVSDCFDWRGRGKYLVDSMEFLREFQCFFGFLGIPLRFLELYWDSIKNLGILLGFKRISGILSDSIENSTESYLMEEFKYSPLGFCFQWNRISSNKTEFN